MSHQKQMSRHHFFHYHIFIFFSVKIKNVTPKLEFPLIVNHIEITISVKITTICLLTISCSPRIQSIYIICRKPLSHIWDWEEASFMKAQGHPTRTQKHSCMNITIHTTEREPAFSAEVTQIFTRHPFNAQCGLFLG